MAKKSMSSSESSSKESLYTPIGAIVALLLITLIAVYSGGSGSSSTGPTGLAIGMSCQADADCGNAKEVCYSNVCVNKVWVAKLDKMSAEKKQQALLFFKKKYEQSQPQSQPTPPPSEPTPAPQPAEPTKQCVLDLNYDLTGDGYVGNKDLDFMKGILFKQLTCPSGKTCDLNGDGKVDTADMQLFLNTNKACIDAANVDPTLEKSVCGNNFLETGEACDGTNVLATLKTCPAGTTGTVTACKNDCSGADTSACVAKCTKTYWGSYKYGTQSCGNALGSCNDDPTKGTVGCCTEKQVLGSEKCEAKLAGGPKVLYINQSISSCTGSFWNTTENIQDCSKDDKICGTSSNGQLGCITQPKCTKDKWGIYKYGDKFCSSLLPESCNDNPTKGTVGCCTVNAVPGSYCEGTVVVNQTISSCTSEKTTYKTDCTTLFLSVDGKSLPATGCSEGKCVADSSVLKCMVKTNGGMYYGVNFCGFLPGSCNDDSAKGTVGCCKVDVVSDSTHCQANLLVNQTISSCTGEKTTTKKDCSVGFTVPKVCGAVNNKYNCYETCTEKGSVVGLDSGQKMTLNLTQGSITLSKVKYDGYYCTLDSLKSSGSVYVDVSGKPCDKDVKLSGCFYDNSYSTGWPPKPTVGASYYTMVCSDSGKVYLAEPSKEWCGYGVNTCNPSTGCVK